MILQFEKDFENTLMEIRDDRTWMLVQLLVQKLLHGGNHQLVMLRLPMEHHPYVNERLSYLTNLGRTKNLKPFICQCNSYLYLRFKSQKRCIFCLFVRSHLYF